MNYSNKQEQEQEQEYLFDPKSVHVVYTIDTINIIKIVWLPMTSHVNQILEDT